MPWNSCQPQNGQFLKYFLNSVDFVDKMCNNILIRAEVKKSERIMCSKTNLQYIIVPEQPSGRKEPNMYVLQYRVHDWEKWRAINFKFQTVDEAKAALEKEPFKSMYRIAEEYTEIRYKAVK